MEPLLLEPLTRFLTVEHAADLTGLAARIPGSGFLCFYPNDEEYTGFVDGTGRLWLRGDDATPARELLEVLDYLDSLRFVMAESGQLLAGVVRGELSGE